MPPQKKYYLYILRCKDKTLYCGITNDLLNRVKMHNSGKGSAYVRSRGGGRVVYSEILKNKSLALKKEAAIKKLTRASKLALIRQKKTRQ
jgi:putative endonuclease